MVDSIECPQRNEWAIFLTAEDAQQYIDKYAKPYAIATITEKCNEHWHVKPIENSPNNLKRLYDRCTSANGFGECVLADGHETHQFSQVGSKPVTSHIDRWGQHWGVMHNG